jgi:hypothetical protein
MDKIYLKEVYISAKLLWCSLGQYTYENNLSIDNTLSMRAIDLY